eukprot:scaffold59055_cov37-Attheya_sp.AAC.1
MDSAKSRLDQYGLRGNEGKEFYFTVLSTRCGGGFKNESSCIELTALRFTIISIYISCWSPPGLNPMQKISLNELTLRTAGFLLLFGSTGTGTGT